MENYLPPNTPVVYRGGQELRFKLHEVKTDRLTGIVKTSHGVSVDADPARVQRFGGAYQVVSIPQGLNIIQRGQRESHHEIVPVEPMPVADYQDLLNRVKLIPYSKESSQ